MKKLLFFTALMLSASFSFAQKKAVKEAKSNIDKTEDARSLIKPALTDPETADDAETWMVAGNVEYNAFSKQYDAEMTKQFNNNAGWNEEIVATSLYNMLPYYIKADELGEKPDAKGKIKNKARKDIVKNITVAYPFLINAGVYYNTLGQNAAENDSIASVAAYAKAADLFEYFWDIPSWTMFASNPIADTENTPVIKIYAIYASMSAKEHDRAVKLLNRLIAEPYVENETYKPESLYELLASEYQMSGDKDKYIEVLELGTRKFPTNKYFTPNYINEMINADREEDAIKLLDQAIANDPSSSCDLMSVKSSLLVGKKRYDESIKVNKELLDKDPNCNRAQYNLGYVYALKAEDLGLQSNSETNPAKQKELDKESLALYKEALPYLVKYKTSLESTIMDGNTYKSDADLTDYKNVVFILNSVYYTLTFYKEAGASEGFSSTEKILKDLKDLGYY